MNKFLIMNRNRILLACCAVSLPFVAIFALNIRTQSQQLKARSQNARNDALEQLENSLDQPLTIAGNDDCPLRILEAKIKRVSGSQFTELTGKTTDLTSVASVPEVTLVNNTSTTITAFVLAIRDPKTRATRGFVQRRVSIGAGETYIVKREHFVDSEKQTVADGKGAVRQKWVLPKMDSEKYWIQFAGQAEMFITVGQISFADGSSWMIKEGGQVK